METQDKWLSWLVFWFLLGCNWSMTCFSNRNSWARNSEFSVIMHTFLILPLNTASVSYLDYQLNCNNIPLYYIALCGFQRPSTSLSLSLPLSPNSSSLYDRRTGHYYFALQIRKQKKRDLTKIANLRVGAVRIWPCPITQISNGSKIVIGIIIVIVIAVTAIVSVAMVTEMKTSQLSARCFTSIGRWCSSPLVGWKTSQAQRQPLWEFRTPEPVPCPLPMAVSTTHSHHSSAQLNKDAFLPGPVKCSDFLQPSRGWSHGRRPEEDPALLILAKSRHWAHVDSAVAEICSPNSRHADGVPKQSGARPSFISLLRVERSWDACQGKVKSVCLMLGFASWGHVPNQKRVRTESLCLSQPAQAATSGLCNSARGSPSWL